VGETRQTNSLLHRQEEGDSFGSAGEGVVERLVADLSSRRPTIRMAARDRLVGVGDRAVPALVELLHSPAKRVRWEAAKALSAIGSLEAAPALLGALVDESTEVRWLAGEGLIAAGPEVIPLALQFALSRAGSKAARGALARVFRALMKEEDDLGPLLDPVVRALDSLEAADVVPGEALKALDEIRESGMMERLGRSERVERPAPVYLFDSAGHWIAFGVGVYVFDVKERWIGWAPWDEATVVDLEGGYLGTIVNGDRLYKVREHPVFTYPGFPGYPDSPPPLSLPPVQDYDDRMPDGTTDVGLARA